MEYAAVDRPAHCPLSDRAAGTAAVRQPFAGVGGIRRRFANRVHVAGGGQLYLRSMADMNARPIPGTNLDVMSPIFSPDGQWIVFFSFQDSTLKKIAVTGGAPLTICKSDPPFGLTWERDWIVFADQGTKGILRVSVKRRGTGSAGGCPGW